MAYGLLREHGMVASPFAAIDKKQELGTSGSVASSFIGQPPLNNVRAAAKIRLGLRHAISSFL